MMLFLLGHGSGTDTSSMVQGVLWPGGGSKDRRCLVDAVASIVRAKASHVKMVAEPSTSDD
jgi:hypothetical protein